MDETYLWVYNIIESCNNDFHFDCSYLLISLFKIKHGDSDKVLELRSLWRTKWNAVHAVLN